MKPCKPYVYEFLFRGRPEGSSDAPAWHVAIESRVDTGLGHVAPHVVTLNMERAKAEGWTLPKIIADINADAMAEADRLRDENEMLRLQFAENEKTLTKAAATITAQTNAVQMLQARISELEGKPHNAPRRRF